MKFTWPIILQVTFMTLSGILQAQESTLVYPGQDGKLVYVPHANTQESDTVNVIPDFSLCGYKGGGVAIPYVPVKATVFPQEGNDRARIQAAIDAVCALPLDANGFRGAVLLKAGTYEVNDGNIPTTSNGWGNALLISKSGVVLRGEGQGPDGTILISDAEKQHTLLCIQPSVSPQRTTSNTTRITDAYVGTGAKSFNVASTSGFSVGGVIFVTFTPNSAWLNDIYVNPYLNVAGGDILWDTGNYTIRYERKITAITGNLITINSPVVQPMQTKYGGGQISLMTITAGERLYNVGVENLRLEGSGITPTSSETSTKRLQFAIRPRYIENGWIHGVTAVHASESTVKTWDCNYFTVEECAYIDPLGPKEGGWRYAFGLDAGSQHILFQRNYSYDGRHDFVSHAKMPGPNVFLDCYSKLGTTIGPHERFATGTLFDNISMQSLMAVSEQRGTSGSGHGWAGVQQIAWNLECSSIVCDAPKGHQNYAIGCIGTEVLSTVSGKNNTNSVGVYRGYYESKGTHVTTRSLYLKQLEDRFGSAAIANITIPEQQTGNIYSKLANWAGNGPLVTNTGIAVSITSPASGANYSAPQVITINATASDADGSITQVDFYINGSFTGTATTSPYSVTYSIPYDGVYSLTARATDNTGKITTSKAISIYVNAIDHTNPPGTGTITKRAEISNSEGALKAFDKLTTTKWVDNGGIPNAPFPSWIQIQFPTDLVVNTLAITSANDEPDKDPSDFSLKASNDGITWITLKSWSTQTWANRVEEKVFSFSNNVSYNYYRLEITKNQGNVGDTQLSEIKLFWSAQPVIAVTGISVSPAMTTLNLKNTEQLTATILPANASNKTVTWTSGNTSVATVNSSGLVTALAAGTAFITATTQDGAKTATSVITVTSVEAYTYNPSEDTYVRGGTYSTTNYGTTTQIDIKQGSQSDFMRKGLVKFDLRNLSLSNFTSAKLRLFASSAKASTISVYPIDDNWSESTVTWNNAPANGSSISSVAVSASNVYYEFDVTAFVQEQLAGDGVVSLGIWDIGASNVNVSFNSREASSSKPELFVQTSGNVTTINDLNTKTGKKIVSIYPNPLSQDVLTIKMDGYEDLGNVDIIITNLQGQTVYQNQLCGNNSLEISTYGLLKSSIYIVSIKYGQSIVTKKIIVQ